MIKRRFVIPLAAVVAFVAISVLLTTSAAAPPLTKFGASLTTGHESGFMKSAQHGAHGRFTAGLVVTTLVYKLTFSDL